ncbi:hypothetical protein GS488_05900 [Rhodococcus hoagii]|nr:hypothetical protein [Prescottella equi]
MTHPEDVPTLTLPREDMMRLVMAFRAGAGLLRRVREMQGRSAFSDAEHAARREAIARSNGLQQMTPADAEEQGQVFTEQHDSGMTVRVAPLSGDRFGVQAGWEDNHTTAVVGSKQMADDLRAWLRNNSHGGSVNDLRVATEELDEYAHTEQSPRDRRMQGALEWMNEPEQAEIRAQWDAKANNEWRGENGFEPGRRDDWLMDEWRKATRTAGESNGQLLADRVRDRVPESVLNNSRWHVAEEQFSKLVRDGADPDLLADSVAGIRFDDSIRSPAGFAAWTMRDAVKRGRAHTPGEHVSEDEAKREVAAEWLVQSDPDSPLDRARAAQLVGQIDDRFDAQIADRYPGLLDGDRDRGREQANGRAEFHEANARAADSAVATHEAESRDADDEWKHDRESGAEAGWDAQPRDPEDARTAATESERKAEADGAAQSDHAHAADERDRGRQERTTAETAASQPTEAARRADTPLKRPSNAPKAQNGLPRKIAQARPAAKTQERVPKRSL